MTNAEEKIAMLRQIVDAVYREDTVRICISAEDENDEPLEPDGIPSVKIEAGDNGELCVQLDFAFACPEGGSFKAHLRLPKQTLGEMLAGLLRTEEMRREREEELMLTGEEHG